MEPENIVSSYQKSGLASDHVYGLVPGFIYSYRTLSVKRNISGKYKYLTDPSLYYHHQQENQRNRLSQPTVQLPQNEAIHHSRPNPVLGRGQLPHHTPEACPLRRHGR